MKSFPHLGVLALTLGLAVTSGCASGPRVTAQWRDPALVAPGKSLLGEKVLVACDAYDLALQRICENRLYSEISSRGATPVVIPVTNGPPTDGEPGAHLLRAAQLLGAKVIFTISLSPTLPSSGSGVSLGLGGFSFGGGGGVGVGLSIPLSGRGEESGIAASGQVVDVQSKRLLWTATLVTAPSSDAGAQVQAITRSVLDSAKGGGLF